MKKILVIGASNSRKSINKIFATYVAGQLEDVQVIVADLNELELPLYSPHLEEKNGIPANAVKFKEMITASDGIVLSLAEHNGMLTAAFKNLWDWASRIDVKIWQDKPMLLLSASPGGRGGASALKTTKDLLPHFGGNIIADFSLPRFYSNFGPDGLSDETLQQALDQKIKLFHRSL